MALWYGEWTLAADVGVWWFSPLDHRWAPHRLSHYRTSHWPKLLHKIWPYAISDRRSHHSHKHPFLPSTGKTQLPHLSYTMNFQWKKGFHEMVLCACTVAQVPGEAGGTACLPLMLVYLPQDSLLVNLSTYQDDNRLDQQGLTSPQSMVTSRDDWKIPLRTWRRGYWLVIYEWVVWGSQPSTWGQIAWTIGIGVERSLGKDI